MRTNILSNCGEHQKQIESAGKRTAPSPFPESADAASFPFVVVGSICVSCVATMTTMSSLEEHIIPLRPFLDKDLDVTHDITDILSQLSKHGKHLYDVLLHFEPVINNVCSRLRHEPNVPTGDLDDEDHESNEESLVYSLGVLVYICQTQPNSIPPFFIPAIYSETFILTSQIPIVHCLLERSETECVRKGIAILIHSLEKMSQRRLKLQESCYDDVLRKYPIHSSLVKVIRYSDKTSNREDGLKALKQLIRNFEPRGSKKFIDILISSPSQVSGVVELALSEYKNFLIQGNPEFCSKNSILQTVGRVIEHCKFHESMTSNAEPILERSDAILGLLNFILFLSLRQTNGDEDLDIRNLREHFFTNLLIPLEKQITDARNHYLLELRRVRSEDLSARQQKLQEAKNLSLMVANDTSDQVSDEISEDYEEKGICICLTRLELIGSVRRQLWETLNG